MYSSSQGSHTATGTHIPHGITQCYLPPGRGDIPALTPAEASTRLSNPGGMQGWAMAELHTHTHTHTFNGPFPGLPGCAGTRKVTPIWIFVKQETVSGSGISWAVCKSAPRSRQITTPAHNSVVTGRMPFLPPNQQRQSTEGRVSWI